MWETVKQKQMLHEIKSSFRQSTQKGKQTKTEDEKYAIEEYIKLHWMVGIPQQFVQDIHR